MHVGVSVRRFTRSLTKGETFRGHAARPNTLASSKLPFYRRQPGQFWAGGRLNLPVVVAAKMLPRASNALEREFTCHHKVEAVTDSQNVGQANSCQQEWNTPSSPVLGTDSSLSKGMEEEDGDWRRNCKHAQMVEGKVTPMVGKVACEGGTTNTGRW